MKLEQFKVKPVSPRQLFYILDEFYDSIVFKNNYSGMFPQKSFITCHPIRYLSTQWKKKNKIFPGVIFAFFLI